MLYWLFSFIELWILNLGNGYISCVGVIVCFVWVLVSPLNKSKWAYEDFFEHGDKNEIS